VCNATQPYALSGNVNSLECCLSLKVRDSQLDEGADLHRKKFAAWVDNMELPIGKSVIWHDSAELACFDVVVDEVIGQRCDSHSSKCAFPYA
jgi:hypothetical protein